MHTVDGTTRRFQHTDADPHAGLAVVAQALSLPSLTQLLNVRFDVHFGSGPLGVVDRVAVTLPMNEALLNDVRTSLHAKTPEEALGDEHWAPDFVELVSEGTGLLQVRHEVAAFVEAHRAPFQPALTASDRCWFGNELSLDSWQVVWQSAGLLSVLSVRSLGTL